MNIEKRISHLEVTNSPETLPEIEITFVSCSQQVKNPELFRKVPDEITIAGKKAYRLEPKDSNFTCDCHCCKSKANKL